MSHSPQVRLKLIDLVWEDLRRYGIESTDEYDTILPLIALLIFPSGLFVLAGGLVYEWVDRKLVARFQNRIGPRWFQPLADLIKLLAKEEFIPDGVNARPVRRAAQSWPWPAR